MQETKHIQRFDRRAFRVIRHCLLHLLPHDLPRLYFRIILCLVTKDHSRSLEAEGPDLSCADVIRRHGDFGQVHENVFLRIDLVSSAISIEASESRQLFLVGWFAVVFPGGTIGVHQLRAHVAIGAVDQKSDALRPNQRIEDRFPILQHPLRRNKLPRPNDFLLYFVNA